MRAEASVAAAIEDEGRSILHGHIQHLSNNNLMVPSWINSVCRTGKMDVRTDQPWLTRGPLNEMLFQCGVTTTLGVVSR